MEPPQRINPLLTHFIPMFLDTALCAIRECLIHDFSHFHIQGSNPPTFAISLQLLPASRIVFSLCSSAGVHGVFVLLFFGGGADNDDSAKVGDGSPRPPVSPKAEEVMGGDPAVIEDPGALRFLEDGGLVGGGSAGRMSCG